MDGSCGKVGVSGFELLLAAVSGKGRVDLGWFFFFFRPMGRNPESLNLRVSVCTDRMLRTWSWSVLPAS